MYTYQDFLEIKDNLAEYPDFIAKVINEHKSSREYKIALNADEYNAERNITILRFVKMLYGAAGEKLMDETATNMKITSNFFNLLNTQRCAYSLGKGITFTKEGVKERLGDNADDEIYKAGYYGLIHGLSFLYWAFDHIHVFKLTEFAPLWDETTSDLGAGIRFWQICEGKPIHAILYTPDGYIEYSGEKGNASDLKPATDKFLPYRMTIQSTPAVGGDVETAHNYSALPIIPLWGSCLKQSTLVGMQSKIDAFDSVMSGFANDMTECSQIYWLVNNAGGMTENDLAKFRNRLLYRHIATVPSGDGVEVQPYTQEIPYAAREALLDRIRKQIYFDFGALDTTNISAASKTATEIEAAYQSVDDIATDFEKNIKRAVKNLLSLQGITGDDSTPNFTRKKIANEMEQVQMVSMEATYLDHETILNKFPNITPEEVQQIMKKKAADDLDRFGGGDNEDVTDDGNA